MNKNRTIIRKDLFRYVMLYSDVSIINYEISDVNNEFYSFYSIYIYKKQNPIITLQKCKLLIIDDINSRTDEKILTGFVWNEKPVYLSSENQFNFKAAYDLAVQTQGQSLPVTFKLGEKDGEPVYYEFTNMVEFTDFYVQAISFINNCLKEGWREKDSIDLEPYKEFFEEEEKPQTEPEEQPQEESQEEN